MSEVTGPVSVEYTEREFRAKIHGFELTFGAEKEWDFVDKVVDGIIPSEYLIVAIGGCAAMHTIRFCKRNKLPTEGVKVDLAWKGNARKGELINTIILNVTVPRFPQDLEPQLRRELGPLCTVTASISLPPKFEVHIKQRE